jgi:hypothetical protein
MSTPTGTPKRISPSWTEEPHIKWSKPNSERQRLHDFAHMWTTDPNTSINMTKMGLLEETKGEWKEEKNYKEWIILKYITAVWE